MTLKHPFCISYRLLPAVKVGDAYISIEFTKRPGRDGMTRFKYYIDTPGFEYSADDLQTWRGNLQDGMENLLVFLVAAAAEPGYLFPEHVGEWADRHLCQLEELQLTISETPDLIVP